jgi:hypothetical protein
MGDIPSPRAEPALFYSEDEIDALLRDTHEPIPAALLENPRFNEVHLCRVLERAELSAALLERIAGHKDWLHSRGVQCGLVAHPRTPRHIAMKAARDLHAGDLSAITLRPTTPPEVRRFAEGLLIARLPQLPLGQKLALARRGTGRLAGSLLAEGHASLAVAALENARLTESQVLRALSEATLAEAAIDAIANHAKWPRLSNVRLALAKHPRSPLREVQRLLRELTHGELDALHAVPSLRAEVRAAAREEITRRAAISAANGGAAAAITNSTVKSNAKTDLT